MTRTYEPDEGALIDMPHPSFDLSTDPKDLEPIFAAIYADPRCKAIEAALPQWRLPTQDGRVLRVARSGWNNESIFFHLSETGKDERVYDGADSRTEDDHERYGSDETLMRAIEAEIHALGIGVELSFGSNDNAGEVEFNTRWLQRLPVAYDGLATALDGVAKALTDIDDQHAARCVSPKPATAALLAAFRQLIEDQRRHLIYLILDGSGASESN